MCDVLQGIYQAVGVVIAGVDAPGVAGMGVMRKLDSVGYEVPHHSHIILVISTHPASPTHASPTGLQKEKKSLRFSAIIMGAS